jgi:serine/threonine-protein kinase RsbW
MTPDALPCPTLTVPSDPRMLSVVRTFLEAVCQAKKVDRNTIHAIILAAGEAVTNIVRHAHRDRPDCSFQVQCQVGPDTVEVNLLDQGEPFDFSQVPHLAPGDLRVGGRGVYLMRVLMDEIICTANGPRGNRLRLVKRWPSKAEDVRECG